MRYALCLRIKNKFEYSFMSISIIQLQIKQCGKNRWMGERQEFGLSGPFIE